MYKGHRWAVCILLMSTSCFGEENGKPPVVQKVKIRLLEQSSLDTGVLIVAFDTKGKPNPRESPGAEDRMPVDIVVNGDAVIPRVIIVNPGQRLRMRSSDGDVHQVRLFSFLGNQFTGNGNGFGAVVDRIGVVRQVRVSERSPCFLKCYSGKMPQASVLIVDQDLAGSAVDTGKVVVKNVPPGTWKFRIWDGKHRPMRKEHVRRMVGADRTENSRVFTLHNNSSSTRNIEFDVSMSELDNKRTVE